MKESPEKVTPHVAALRALEHIAIARRFAQVAGSSMKEAADYELYKEVDTDLAKISTKAQKMLAATSIKA